MVRDKKISIVAIEDLHVEKTTVERLINEILGEDFEFKYYEKKPESQRDLLDRLNVADGIIGVNYPIEKETIEKADRLKVISVSFTGFDHVAIGAATKRRITVCNVPDYASNSVAELTFGLILSISRKIVEADKIVRTEWTRKNILGFELQGKTLGIIGFGSIGQRVSRLSHAFGMKVQALNMKSEIQDSIKDGVRLTNLEKILKTSDIVTLHVPLTDETRNMISKREISLMKKGSILINTSRGQVVAKDALIKALEKERIYAGLDVYDKEPLERNDPILRFRNAVLTPHIGFYTSEALNKRTEIALLNLKSFFENKPQNVIN